MTATLKGSGIESATSDKVSTSFKIDRDLLDGLKNLEDRMAAAVKAKKIKPFKLNRTTIVEDAIRAVLKDIGGQLDRIEGKTAS